MSQTLPYGPGSYSIGGLSDEMIAAGITLELIRGTTANIEVVVGDAQAVAAVNAIVTAHLSAAYTSSELRQKTAGSGTPESSVASSVGNIYVDTTNNEIYYKKTGVGVTGWVRVGRGA